MKQVKLYRILEPVNVVLRNNMNKWTKEDYFVILDAVKIIVDKLNEIKTRNGLSGTGEIPTRRIIDERVSDLRE